MALASSLARVSKPRRLLVDKAATEARPKAATKIACCDPAAEGPTVKMATFPAVKQKLMCAIAASRRGDPS